jgi:FkbM family methyltransferase
MLHRASPNYQPRSLSDFAPPKIMSEARSLSKRVMPAPLLRLGHGTISYWYRLRIWRAVMTDLRGATPADQATLRRSFRRGIISAVKELGKWQDPQLLADATVEVPGIGRFVIRAFSDDLYQVLPSQEARVLAEIRKRLGPGSTFIDAGANIGSYTVPAGRLVGPNGCVFAIEMMPDTAVRLRRNVEENELTNVAIFEHALSDRSGEKLIAKVPDYKFGRASIAFDHRDECARSVMVRTVTLDELLNHAPAPIDLMKLDVEGAEAKVLKGATRILERTTAVIFEQLPGQTEARLLLEQAGFRTRMIDATNALAERT